MAESIGWSWSALPSDLVNRVADCLLATNDVDYYMDLRAVCAAWRRATAGTKNSPDPRFSPSRWIVIDEVSCSRFRRFQRLPALLVNTTTGRALRKYLPMLRNYYVIATTHGGFFVLADRKPPHAACVLNPFTGYLVRFMATMLIGLVDPAAAVIHFEGEPILVLFCDEHRTMYVAGPDSGCFSEFRDWYPYRRVGFLGLFYAGGNVSDKIYDLMSSFGVRPSEMLAVYPFEDFGYPSETRHTYRCFLVESAGELLMIFKLEQHMELFKIDNDRSAPEPVKSIGNRAIFLGYRQCLSVNADKFHSVEANCIYYLKCIDSRLSIYKYDLKDEKEERISVAINTINDRFLCDVDRPFTIIQLLSSYTISVWGSELEVEKSFELLPHVIPDVEEFRLSSYLKDLEVNDD